MLIVISIEIVERESVMTSKEVDGSIKTASALIVKICGTLYTC